MKANPSYYIGIFMLPRQTTESMSEGVQIVYEAVIRVIYVKSSPLRGRHFAKL